MTRCEAALEAAIVTGSVRQSDAPGELAGAILSRLLASGLLTKTEASKVQFFAGVVQRMNSRDFADEIADELLALLCEIEAGAGLRQ